MKKGVDKRNPKWYTIWVAYEKQVDYRKRNSKKFQKGIDKPGVRWYNIQAVARQQSSLKIEQQDNLFPRGNRKTPKNSFEFIELL